MYEMTAKIHEQLGATLKPGARSSSRRSIAEMATQKERVSEPAVHGGAAGRYVCFYPMNKRRGEAAELVLASRSSAARR